MQESDLRRVGSLMIDEYMTAGDEKNLGAALHHVWTSGGEKSLLKLMNMFADEVGLNYEAKTGKTEGTKFQIMSSDDRQTIDEWASAGQLQFGRVQAFRFLVARVNNRDDSGDMFFEMCWSVPPDERTVAFLHTIVHMVAMSRDGVFSHASHGDGDHLHTMFPVQIGWMEDISPEDFGTPEMN